MAWGCGTDAFYAETQPLDPDLGWEADEKATFEWQVTDTLAKYDFFIDLRHDQRYPFSNIYLFVDFTFPNGRTLRDTLACDLADERGRWLGTGFGNLVDHRIGFRSQTGFPLTGDYAIGIRHGPILGDIIDQECVRYRSARIDRDGHQDIHDRRRLVLTTLVTVEVTVEGDARGSTSGKARR